MTNVIISKKDNLIKNIEINGHALCAAYGDDVVCAGISSVVFGICNALAELSEYNTTQIILNDGRVVIPNLVESVQLICQVMIVQLETIRQSYPKYIEISIQ